MNYADPESKEMSSEELLINCCQVEPFLCRESSQTMTARDCNQFRINMTVEILSFALSPALTHPLSAFLLKS